jgi:hypothetical protein
VKLIPNRGYLSPSSGLQVRNFEHTATGRMCCFSNNRGIALSGSKPTTKHYSVWWRCALMRPQQPSSQAGALAKARKDLKKSPRPRNPCLIRRAPSSEVDPPCQVVLWNIRTVCLRKTLSAFEGMPMVVIKSRASDKPARQRSMAATSGRLDQDGLGRRGTIGDRTQRRMRHYNFVTAAAFRNSTVSPDRITSRGSVRQALATAFHRLFESDRREARRS